MLEQSAAISNFILFSLVITFICARFIKVSMLTHGSTRRGQRRLSNGRSHHSLPGCHAGGYWRIQGQRRAGVARYWQGLLCIISCSMTACRCPAHRLDEAFQRQRRQGDDDRYARSPGADSSSCGTISLYRPGQHGNHVLCTGDLLWFGGDQTYLSPLPPVDDNRSCRHYCRHFCCLWVLWIINESSP